MSEFAVKLNEFFSNLGVAKKMVLATSKDDKVTARMMSCIIFDSSFYFQTDKKFLKYEQICANPQVALCIDNIQVEGMSTIWGHPLDKCNAFFRTAFELNYKGSFDSYTTLTDEVLLKVNPTKITLWEYEKSKPYRLFFDIENQIFSKEFYVG